LSFEIKFFFTSITIDHSKIVYLYLECRILFILLKEDSNVYRKVLHFANDVMGFRRGDVLLSSPNANVDLVDAIDLEGTDLETAFAQIFLSLACWCSVSAICFM